MGMVRSGVRVGHPVYMVAKNMCVWDLVVMPLNGYIVMMGMVVLVDIGVGAPPL